MPGDDHTIRSVQQTGIDQWASKQRLEKSKIECGVDYTKSAMFADAVVWNTRRFVCELCFCSVWLVRIW